MADAKDNALLSAIGVQGGLPTQTEDLLSLKSDIMLKGSEVEAEKKKAEKLAQSRTEVELGKEYEKRLEEQKPYTERLMKQQEERPYPEPSKENFQEFATMFSVISALTFSVGGKGRGAGMSAMAALNGALDGYNKGRKDVFDRNMKEFDKKLAEYKSSLESTRDALNIVIKQGDLKTERARALLKQAELNDAGIAAAEIQQGRIASAIKIVDDKIREASKAEARADNLKNSKFLKDYAAGIQAQKKGADNLNLIQEKTGARVDPKVADQVMSIAEAYGESAALQNEVEKHPEWVGRTGQIRNFFNRTIESINTGTSMPDDGGQPELIFAKRYAEYLVRYEQSLAGGAKGFTVFFQRRFNQLLEQNQFNAQGFKNLMEEQRRTLASSASKLSAKINDANLRSLAKDVKERAGDSNAVEGIDKIEGSSKAGGQESRATGQFSARKISP